jgi:hypothetical protein
MRFVNLYLIGYVVFVIGLIWALGKAGALSHLAPIWIVIGIVIAVGIGIMMAVGAGKPTITKE